MKYRYKTETLNICWINAEDSLPEEGRLLNIQLKNNKVLEVYYTREEGYFYTVDNCYLLNEVAYWCYDPKPKGV